LYWFIGNPPTKNHNLLIIITIFNSKIRLCYDERRFLLFLKKRETPPHREVFPEGLKMQDPPLPVSGVIREDVIPCQRRDCLCFDREAAALKKQA
jgi:hypothetical protein